MRRKLFCIFLLPLFFSPVSIADEWSDFSGAGNLWDGQKSITNSEFEKAIETLEAKTKQKDTKQKKKKIKKLSGGGTSLHSSLDPMSEIQEQSPLKKEDDQGMLLNIPVYLYIGENILSPGFYNIYGEKDEHGDIYLSFYQAHSFMGKVIANETSYDFESDDINFVKIIPYNKDYMQLGYGSLDFNAYAYLRFNEPNVRH